MANNNKETGPLQNLFVDIKKIINFIETKDMELAKAAETDDIKAYSELWMNAKKGVDDYVTYKNWWKKSMFTEIDTSFKTVEYEYYMEHPFYVPVKYRDNLLLRGREAFMSEYEERNEYYRMLNGLPPLSDNTTDYIYLSQDLMDKFHVTDNIPVHELSTYIQNCYMDTDEYEEVLSSNPDKKYLKYLGRYKIDPFIARNAHDFDIIRYPNSRSDINPNLLNIFASLYADYREYVMVVLYNPKMEEIYKGYRSFMGFLILSFTLFQIGNKAVESAHSHKYLDDTVIHTLLSMYGIPDSLLLTKEIRRDLAINILKLVRKKGTSEVYYDLIKILGYQDVVISKLMLMKGQQFDKNNNDTATTEVDPYFLQIDIKDDNPYETISSGKAPIYSYHDIIDADPMWWDLPDVQKIIKERNYTMSESKYIVIEAVIHQMKYIFESIYFTRMILDNKDSTDNYQIQVPELFGTTGVSIYDIILAIVCATCMVNGLTGEIITSTDKLMATAGFNFDIDFNLFNEFLETTKYVDKNRINKFLSNLSMQSESDISRIFNDIMYPMREWLERKISSSVSRQEYIEYEAIYRALFTYDITRNRLLDDFEMPIEIIREKYQLSDDDMTALKNFYPHTLNGTSVSVDEYNQNVNISRYHYPFLNYNNPIDWYIHIVIETPEGTEDRGYVYFHDILNCDDIRELTNPDGTRVFMDYEDGEVGWELNKLAVDKALYLIDSLDEDDLNNAYFQIFTPVSNIDGKSFEEGEKLPANLRTGVYKYILRDKIQMDAAGLAVPPKTYFECLERKNPDLYNIICSPETDRFHKNKDAWMNDIMAMVLATETELSVHMKYFEQSILGKEFFFKPLITLIDHFKSIMVDIAKTGLRYVFDDKMDAGGNSNMLKLFDDAKFIIRFTTLKNSGYTSQLGLYDTEHQVKYHIMMKDRSEILRMVLGEGFAAEVREARMGSIHLVDEMKFFKNGKPMDPDGQYSYWHNGEPGTGRWSEEDDILMRTRKGSARIKNMPVDLEGWKEFVESYNPDDENPDYYDEYFNN